MGSILPGVDTRCPAYVKERDGGIVDLQLTLSESFQSTFYCLNHAKLPEKTVSCQDEVVMSTTPAMLIGIGAAARN